MRLIKLRLQMHRSADLTEVSIVTDDQWAEIQKHVGAELYFGEVAGKHSEVSWTLDLAQIVTLTQDEGEIALFRRWFPNGGIGQVSVTDAIESNHERLEKGDDPCVCGKTYEQVCAEYRARG